MGWVLKDDIQISAGPLQAATGLQGGSEAAIHAMRDIFEHEEAEAVVLVDASNAFNSLNRQAALHNIQVICPTFATILINTYRLATRMMIAGGKEILSQEGSTQGDNFAMSFCGLGTAPLQQVLELTSPSVKRVWLADDATGAGKLLDLREWWDTIIQHGSKLGYHVNETKSWLIVKEGSKMEEAKSIFAGTAIKFTSEGKRHLGASIGSHDFRVAYATEKVKNWCEEVEKLAEYAKSQPQAAFAAFIHGEQHRFNYFMRTIPGMEDFMKPLDKISPSSSWNNAH